MRYNDESPWAYLGDEVTNMITIIIGNTRISAFCQTRGWLSDTGYSHANESLRDGIARLIEPYLPLAVLSGHEPLKLRVARKRIPASIMPLDVWDEVPLSEPSESCVINRASARRALSEARRALARAMNEVSIGCQLDDDGNPVKRGSGRPRMTVAQAEARVAAIESALNPPKARIKIESWIAPVQSSPCPRQPWLLRGARINRAV